MDKAKIITVLSGARERIAKGKCTEAYARDANGEKIDPESENACSWCMRGAVIAETPSTYPERRYATEYLMSAIGVQDAGSLYRFSDTNTQAEVLKMFDVAIQMVQNDHTLPLPQAI